MIILWYWWLFTIWSQYW